MEVRWSDDDASASTARSTRLACCSMRNRSSHHLTLALSWEERGSIWLRLCRAEHCSMKALKAGQHACATVARWACAAALASLVVSFGGARAGADEGTATRDTAHVCAYVPLVTHGAVAVVDTATHTLTGQIPLPLRDPMGFAAAISPDGRQVYTSFQSADGTSAVAVVDPSTNTLTDTIILPDNPLVLAVSPDGGLLYASLESNRYRLAIIDVVARQLRQELPLGPNYGYDAPLGLVLNGDGTYAYLAETRTGQIVVADLHSGEVVATIATSPIADPRGVSLTPDGATLFVAGSGALVAVDTVSNAVVASMSVDDFASGTRVTPDGRFVWVSVDKAQGVNHILVIDTQTYTVTDSIPLDVLDTYTAEIAFTPDGAFAYVVADWHQLNCHLNVIDTATHAIVTTIPIDGQCEHLAVGLVQGDCIGPATPTPIFTNSATAAPSATATRSPIPPSPTATVTSTSTRHATPTPTATVTPTPTETLTAPTFTLSATMTPTRTPPPMETATPTNTGAAVGEDSGCSLQHGSTHRSSSFMCLVVPLLAWIRSRRSRTRRPMLLLVAAALLAACMARAAEPASSNASTIQLDEHGKPTVPSAAPPRIRARRAVVAPTPAPPLVVQEAPGGGRMIILDDRFNNDSIGHRDAGGRVSVECTQPGSPVSAVPRPGRQR
jgi:DNA-binding beta-propeller fold protein YncE